MKKENVRDEKQWWIFTICLLFINFIYHIHMWAWEITPGHPCAVPVGWTEFMVARVRRNSFIIISSVGRGFARKTTGMQREYHVAQNLLSALKARFPHIFLWLQLRRYISVRGLNGLWKHVFFWCSPCVFIWIKNPHYKKPTQVLNSNNAWI